MGCRTYARALVRGVAQWAPPVAMYFPKAASDAPSSLKAEATAGAAAGDISGRFDPSALERGAKALKELDSSSNSKAAFEVREGAPGPAGRDADAG